MGRLKSSIWVIGGIVLAACGAVAKTTPMVVPEAYEHVAMPSGFQVLMSELEGPVFADSLGRTLYRWPSKDLRNGSAGERRGKPTCDATRYTENSGLMSPYPPGLILPDVATRPTCIQVWPPVLAAADAKPVGRWSIVTRGDGTKQWAYDGYALYTSVIDKQPGDAFGGAARKNKGDSPPYREVVAPPLDLPQQFGVDRVATGRMIVTDAHYAVYAWDGDKPNKSNCAGACTEDWAPIIAPEPARSQGEWSVIERSPGIKQWAFRRKPLYTRNADQRPQSLEGSDMPGWRNVYMQAAPAAPKEFTTEDTRGGQVLADRRSMTIYIYSCADDAYDQLACDHPDSPQAYRFAVCGRGDPARCAATFPYVIADNNAKSDSRTWSVMEIDPKTGHFAVPGQPGALRVWAYRLRPVYTSALDRAPHDINADAWGEFHGYRNGFKAFWLRDDFLDNAE